MKRGQKPAAGEVRVLIVDDSLMMRELIAEYLAKYPRLKVVGAAKDGREGLDLIRRLQPDVVILDLGMPKMSGIELLRTVRDEKLKAMVVVFSALPSEAARHECLKLGARAVFDKAHD